MTKRELIDEIMDINHTAEPDFLAEFAETELDEYLHHLQEASRPRPLQYAGRATVKASTFENMSNSAQVEFMPNDISLDSTNPQGSVAVAVTDYSVQEDRRERPKEQDGFSQPTKAFSHRPQQSSNDDQAWLF